MSQCSRVLEVLRDGKPHSIQEIHERAGTMRLNSRIADLRRMGYFITYFRKDGLHTYQLLYGIVRETQGADGGASDGNPESRGPSSTDGPPEQAASPGLASPSPAGARQPTLWEQVA